jgi:competence protein ComEA
MSRRDARAAGHQARHARARLQAALGDGGPTLLVAGDGEQAFEYRGPDAPASPGCEGEAATDGGDDAESAGSPGAGPVLRWRLGRRVAVLLGILAVAAVGMFWWQTNAGRAEILPLSGVTRESSAAQDGGSGQGGDTGQSESPGQTEGSGGSGGTGQSSGNSSAGSVVVHVAGAVASPGVVHLPAGSRVHEAVAAAGGGTPGADLNRLNLALVVEDAQKIHVPRHGETVPTGPGPPDAGAGAGGAAGAQAGSKININTAEAAELDALPKVGPVLAQRIVDWRKEHGAFKSIEELDAVDGVGPKMLEVLLPLVTV